MSVFGAESATARTLEDGRLNTLAEDVEEGLYLVVICVIESYLNIVSIPKCCHTLELTPGTYLDQLC